MQSNHKQNQKRKQVFHSPKSLVFLVQYLIEALCCCVTYCPAAGGGSSGVSDHCSPLIQQDDPCKAVSAVPSGSHCCPAIKHPVPAVPNTYTQS